MISPSRASPEMPSSSVFLLVVSVAWTPRLRLNDLVGRLTLYVRPSKASTKWTAGRQMKSSTVVVLPSPLSSAVGCTSTTTCPDGPTSLVAVDTDRLERSERSWSRVITPELSPERGSLGRISGRGLAPAPTSIVR
ncbi:hypothetical protein D1007_17778 [Hordeum vulgare]|nr:hypothetical protein D1007_17778 [Hordeum vulgare]